MRQSETMQSTTAFAAFMTVLLVIGECVENDAGGARGVRYNGNTLKHDGRPASLLSNTLSL